MKRKIALYIFTKSTTKATEKGSEQSMTPSELSFIALIKLQM